jgi:urocanate hydratase
MELNRRDNQRVIRSPHGPELNARSWQTEAPLRSSRLSVPLDLAVLVWSAGS